MREFMKIVENAQVIAGLPVVTLAAGTKLYHGTNVAAQFRIPRGPAWFGENQKTAEQWADWATPDQRGETRTLAFETTRALSLIVVPTYEDYHRLSIEMCGEDEAPYGMLARAFKEAGLDGWHSDNEVMVCNPDQVLRPIGS